MGNKGTTKSGLNLLALYTTMRRIRSFEERVGEMFVRGGTAGSMLHLSIGEEAVAGICAAMKKGDTFTTNHRGHGIFLARGGKPAKMMAEIAGKADGYCHGKGGSMHIADFALGSLGANAIVGGGIPHCVGAAYAYKLRKEKRVSVAFFGDGALQQGILYECMNMAALWKLPVVFACINNQYGMGTHIRQASASQDFCRRARTFGLDAQDSNGADVSDVYAKAKSLVDNARAKFVPGFIMLNCYRFYGHARMDKSHYRKEKEEKEGRKKDPVAHARNKVAKLKPKVDLDLLDEKIAKEMDSAVEHGMSALPPEKQDLFSDVYDPSLPQPTTVRDRISKALADDRQ